MHWSASALGHTSWRSNAAVSAAPRAHSGYAGCMMHRTWRMLCILCLIAQRMPLSEHALLACLTHCAPFQHQMSDCALFLLPSTSMLLLYACTTCLSTGQRWWGSTHLPSSGADPSALAAAAIALAAAAKWRGSRRRWTSSRLWSHQWSQEHSHMPSGAP